MTENDGKNHVVQRHYFVRGTVESVFSKTSFRAISTEVVKVEGEHANLSLRWLTASAAAKSLQLCPTLSDLMDCSLPGSSVHGIFQTRVLEWVVIAFSGPT